MSTKGAYSYDRGLRQTVDWWLVLCYLALVVIGWLSIYASIHSTGPESIFDLGSRSGKQFLWMMVVFAVDVVILFVVNPKLWEVLTPPAYIVVLVLLVLVIFLSRDVKGSHSWFELGPVKFQPAEVSKITTSLMLALVMGRQGFRLVSPRCFLQVALVIGLPMLAILGESETGSALVYLGYMFVLYREGLSGWWLFAFAMAILLFILTLTAGWWLSAAILTAVCALCCLMLLRRRWKTSSSFRRGVVRRTVLAFIAGAVLIFATRFIFENVLQDHQRSRIEVLLGMKEDPSGVGYNVRQSMIAIGSGGFSGKGFLNGTQTTFGFVPEQSTDFIFCTLLRRDLPVCVHDIPHHAGRRQEPGGVHAHLRQLPCSLSVHAPVHKHRHDHRADAGDRHTAASAELRGFVAACILGAAVHLPGAQPAGKQIFLIIFAVVIALVVEW